MPRKHHQHAHPTLPPRARHTHRHSGIFLPFVPPRGTGAVVSLAGLGTRQPRFARPSHVGTKPSADRGPGRLIQALTQTKTQSIDPDSEWAAIHCSVEGTCRDPKTSDSQTRWTTAMDRLSGVTRDDTPTPQTMDSAKGATPTHHGARNTQSGTTRPPLPGSGVPNQGGALPRPSKGP